MRGQAAVEYIFVVAIALMIIVPGTMLFYQYTSSTQDTLLTSQIFKSGNTVITTAKLMHTVGDNSWKTVEFSLPAGFDDMIIYSDDERSELALKYNDDKAVVFFTEYPMRLPDMDPADDCVAGCPVPVQVGSNVLRVESFDGEVILRVLT